MSTATTSPGRVLLGATSSLGAAVCYGASSLIARRIVSDYAPPLVGTAFSLLFGTLVLALFAHRHLIEDASRGVPRRTWVFLSLAGLAASWGVGSMFMALKRAPVVLVAPI